MVLKIYKKETLGIKGLVGKAENCYRRMVVFSGPGR
jgi:hypothetical protein